MFPELTTIGDRLVRLSTTLVERIRTWTKRAFQVNIIKTILSIQLAITLVALSIQLYALCSAKWALFHSRVELGKFREREKRICFVSSPWLQQVSSRSMATMACGQSAPIES